MKHLSHLLKLVIAFGLLTLDGGCANTQQARQQTENLLSAAGFKMVTANSSQQQLRPYKVTAGQRDRKTYYVYLNPAQKLLYVGNQAQYQQYLRLRQAYHLAEEKLEAAEQNYRPPVFP